MTLDQFTRFIKAIDSYYGRTDELNKALETFNESWMMLSFCPLITESIFDYLKEIFNDEDDWIGWWYWEGKGKNEATYSDGSRIILDTIEDLYNFLIKNKKENENE